MKKIIAILFASVLVLSLAACGGKKEDSNTDNVDATPVQQTDSGETASTDWPTETVFPKPEGCKIVEVRSEGWKHYITVEWDSKEAAKNYIDIAKEVEGDTAEVIGQGETDDSVYYGTYGITITSMNEAENIVLYK